MTTPAHPWRADRTWHEDGAWVASTHTWPTELEARNGAARLVQGRDLPAGSTDVEVVLSEWQLKVRGWRTVDTGEPVGRPVR